MKQRSQSRYLKHQEAIGIFMTEQPKGPDALDYSTQSIVDLSVLQSKARLTPGAVDGFVAIMKAWKVSDEDARNLLGMISPSRYAAMKIAAFHEELPEDILIRIAYLIEIFKALHTQFGSRLANAWMTRPNTNSMFCGATPLTYCLDHGINGLRKLRKLLDAKCQGC